MLFGISLPAIVGLLIELFKKVGVVSTGDQARLANIILSSLGALAVSLITEINLQVPQVVLVIVAAVYSIAASALGYTVIENRVNKE